MKNLLLGMLLLVSAALSAQTMQGQWMVGGSAGFTSTTADFDGNSGDAVTTISINPNLGYFVIDNLAIGLNLGFSTTTDQGSNFVVGPLVRYYFVNLGESAKLFAQGRFNFLSHSPDEGDSTSGTEWGVGAGLAWFLNPHVALEGLLEYSSAKPDSDVELKYNTFGFRVGFQIHLGGE